MTRTDKDKILTMLAERWLAEHFRANCAWLYVLEEDRSLVAFVTHNTTTRGCRKSIDDAHGVVAHVARTRQGMRLDDVAACSFYDDSVPETRSELCVPIVTSEKDGRLLAVRSTLAPTTDTPPVVVLNWFEELRARTAN